jgi:asparagine synthase (glutamine-hydrolysing)
MCGIAGVLSRSAVSREDIESMTQVLAHRGPDAHGYYMRDGVALGHRRLSIIDLDARANQPFHSRNGRFVIVFNGEIYNYQSLAAELVSVGVSLRTTSDTEVLVEAFGVWGTGFVQKLRGMFALAIYDNLERRLYLYRDRVGKKPLYYASAEGAFVFASEIKSILKHPSAKPIVSKKTISSFLQLGYIPQPNTFFQGIFKFPAGHYGIVTTEGHALFPYWNVSHYLKTTRDITEANAVVQLKRLLNQSVKDRLVADVPVGVFLSGGIDSSIVAAVASQSVKLKTFSIGFKESKFDESIYAEKIARHLGCEHYRQVLTEQHAVGLIEKYLDHFDEPFADTSAVPTMLVSELARKEVKVALTGDGGDELFLGYGSYTWANRLASPVWKFFRPAIKSVMSAVPSPRWKRAAHLFEKTRSEKLRRHIFSQEQYFYSDYELRDQGFIAPDYYFDWVYDDFRNLRILSEAERQALFDFQFYLRDDLLVKVDRSSMYYGLECRCPLLDHRLVEFAYNLPESFRKTNLTTKYLLRKVLYESVPESFFNRPKQGFSVPLAHWLKSDLNYLMDYLLPGQLEKVGVFNVSHVRNLVARFYSGEDYLYNRLWVAILTQRFLLQYA